jgi:carboxyl-terminal processing protease
VKIALALSLSACLAGCHHQNDPFAAAGVCQRSGANRSITHQGQLLSPEQVNHLSSSPTTHLPPGQSSVYRFKEGLTFGQWVEVASVARQSNGRTSNIFVLNGKNGTSFRDPVSYPRHCTASSDGFDRCTSYAYIPSDTESLDVVVTGYGKSTVEVDCVTLTAINAADLPKPSTDDTAKFENAMQTMQARFFRPEGVNWNALTASARAWLPSPSGKGYVSAVAWAASQLPSNGHTFVMFAARQAHASTDAMHAGSSPSSAAPGSPPTPVVFPFQNEPGIAYLKVDRTPLNPADQPEYIRTLQTAIADALHRGATRWVVDMRGNSGGSLYAMTAAMDPLIPSTKLGYFRDNRGRDVSWGETKEGFSMADHPIAKYARTTPMPTDAIPLVVLIDHRCASSCEILASGLASALNAPLLGSRTAGVPTGNVVHPIDSVYSLVLTEAVSLDANMKPIGDAVEPTATVADDDLLTTAIKTLKANGDNHVR